MFELTLFWFRRDLRYHDNRGFYEALKQSRRVLPLFIFDKHILDELESKRDMRINFIYRQLQALDAHFRRYGSGLVVKYGTPEAVLRDLLQQFPVQAIFTNRDYEPYATARDKKIELLAKQANVAFRSFKDQVVFEQNEVLKGDGTPYTVFTPYMKKWKAQFQETDVAALPSENYLQHLTQDTAQSIPALETMGFSEEHDEFPSKAPDLSVIANYDQWRDFPGEAGTTRLGVHFRFGTVSIRHMMKLAAETNEAWWNELIWREFYMMILWHFPHVVDHAFKSQYDRIPWRNNEREFEAWKNGRTGYPIVDAGMRELNQTGYMHNRVRMVTASFLVKHLLIDWRWGERYFAEKLLDYELSSNNGGWQWAAGSGCDAAPYFRVFNPYLQQKRFDPDMKYVRKWVPEAEQATYITPLVAHKAARERALQVYKEALG